MSDCLCVSLSDEERDAADPSIRKPSLADEATLSFVLDVLMI